MDGGSRRRALGRGQAQGRGTARGSSDGPSGPSSQEASTIFVATEDLSSSMFFGSIPFNMHVTSSSDGLSGPSSQEASTNFVATEEPSGSIPFNIPFKMWGL